MIVITAKDHINAGFSEDDAIVLNNLITPHLDKGEMIMVDFTELRGFTTLFFNQTFSKYLVAIGVEMYEKQIYVSNLSLTGYTAYQNSISNAKAFLLKRGKGVVSEVEL